MSDKIEEIEKKIQQKNEENNNIFTQFSETINQIEKRVEILGNSCNNVQEQEKSHFIMFQALTLRVDEMGSKFMISTKPKKQDEPAFKRADFEK